MSQIMNLAIFRAKADGNGAAAREPLSAQKIMRLLGVCLDGSSHGLCESLPFSVNDATVGAENELQAVVMGKKSDVDLPLSIEQSNYYANIIRRAQTGETPKKLISNLERFLNENEDRVWENSWVRFPLGVLSSFAQEILERDLLADKEKPWEGYRCDLHKFLFLERGEQCIRTPISYLIKLSLADVIGSQANLPDVVKETGKRLLDCFLSDNTSPETYSFHVVPLRPESGMGKAIAEETARRFLLTSLLTMYANESFTLRATGQEVLIYLAPHPPIRQKQLNDCISDAFYRELFMSPCLSGWNRGEEKHRYMELCHQVLSRSQLNAVAKLREAGIITRNLVILPNLSNTSLANNGVHISIGSVRLSERLRDGASGMGATEEKYLGDLIIKIVEHFLPLFVGSYSAAPYGLDFRDLHPEKVLGFLPHELDYTHLRMIWRRWKKKVKCKLFGQPLTPFGPEWLDRLVSGVLCFKGDYVPDFRLIDYFAALMSTEKSSALDGTVGNCDRLKKDLTDLGVYDPRMAVYMLYRLREFEKMGFSGFEGRHYSLFHSLNQDMSAAADLQTLITALAFKYVAQGKIDHAHIPDAPFIESERRQIFFGAAIGIPTFYVRKDTKNAFLKEILQDVERVRSSRRYAGYLRVYNAEYRKALVRKLEKDGADLVEMLNLQKTMRDLSERMDNPQSLSAEGKLSRGILDGLNARSPFDVGADEFNRGAERYYRGALRVSHLQEAFDLLKEDIGKISEEESSRNGTSYRKELRFILGERNVSEFLAGAEAGVLDGRVSQSNLKKLIDLLLLTINYHAAESEKHLNGHGRSLTPDEAGEPSIHRAEHW